MVLIRTFFPVLVALIYLLFIQETAYASPSIRRSPVETIVLKLSDTGCANWKDMTRSITEKEGLIERIPSNQSPENWSELICIQYYDRSLWNKEIPESIENIVNRVRDQTRCAYLGNKVTWKIIEKNKNDIIYEWILHEPHVNTPAQHEIARFFLTETGCHRVGFTRKNIQMSVDEREKWIKLLKEAVIILPFKDAAGIPEALSMVDITQDVLDLGFAFSNWRVLHTYDLDNGNTLVNYLPPSQIGVCPTECLEVMHIPYVKTTSIEGLFELEKKNVQKQSSKEVIFDVLKKSQNEIIYSYSQVKNRIPFTAVVRAFISDEGYYSISYKNGVAGDLKKEEILQWKTRLEMIKKTSPH